MSNDEIDIIFNITILIHEHEWFGKRKKPRNREEVQEWVAKRLAGSLDIYTIPSGMSWGYQCSKEEFKEYWSKNGKLKDE